MYEVRHRQQLTEDDRRLVAAGALLPCLSSNLGLILRTARDAWAHDGRRLASEYAEEWQIANDRDPENLLGIWSGLTADDRELVTIWSFASRDDALLFKLSL